MTIESAAPTLVAASGQGTAPAATGQAGLAPAGSIAPSQPSGQPTEAAVQAAPATPTEQPKDQAWDSEMGWKSPDDAKRDYKNIQSLSTKLAQQLKDLGDPASIKQLKEFVGQLQNDPAFLDWAAKRLAVQQTGSDDPETIKALAIVDQRAEAKARELVAPMRAFMLQQKVEKVFGEMKDKYTAGWTEHKKAMGELHMSDMQRGIVHPNAEEAFDFDYVEGLYRRVVASDPNYAAKEYEKQLTLKRSQSTTSQSGTAPTAVGHAKVNSFEEAAALARRQLGLA